MTHTAFTHAQLFEFAGSGLILVLSVLVLIALSCYTLAFIIRVLQPSGAVNKPEKPPLSEKEQTRLCEDEESDEESIVAAISAAVLVALDKPHRIVHIQKTSQSPNWISEGRQQIHSSHKTR